MSGSIKLVLSNTYGHPNVGDEAILTAMISDIQKLSPAVEITILSLRPELTEKKHPGCRVLKSGILRGWFSTIKAIKNADVLIVGGGGIIQDSTSIGNLLFHLSRPLMALLLGVPVFYFALGVGPLKTPLSRRLTAWVLGKGELITVRDQVSADLLQAIGIRSSLIEITVDPAVNLELADGIEGTPVYRKVMEHKADKILIGLSLRPIPDQKCSLFLQPGQGKRTAWFVEEMVRAVDELIEHFDGQMVFFSMHPGQDDYLGRLIGERIAEPDRFLIISGDILPSHMLSLMRQIDLLIGMRLHSLIFASRSRKPAVGLGYDPKVAGFMGMIHQDQWLLLPDEWQASKIVSSAVSLWERRNQIAEELDERMTNLRKKEILNLEKLKEIMVNL